MDITPHLKTRSLGRNFLFFPEVASTNVVASELAGLGMPEGTVVCADSQTAGRGRQRRHWFSPPGCNLYFSVVLRPDRRLSETSQLALVAGLAVALALEGLPGARARSSAFLLKWPNDVLLDGRKVCGILCEMPILKPRPALIVGIGVNVGLETEDLPPELRTTATSLKAALGVDVPRDELLAAILLQLEMLYAQWLRHGLSGLLPALSARSFLKGRRVVAETPAGTVEGMAQGMLPSGNLAVLLEDGSLAEIAAGDVHLRAASPRP